MTRRSFVQLTAAPLVVASASRPLAAASPPRANEPPKPPALPPEKVQAIVGAAHRDLEQVRSLLDELPLLANACWDWGGGDFETPLQAAAHTGRSEIAELLLTRAARVDLYAAAMLGQLDFVKSALAADVIAGAAVPGPHGFTLLHCARQGGKRAQRVVDWLLGQGVPDVGRRPLRYQ